MKKKTAILIFSAAAALLVALTVILVLVLHKDYIKKTKFDHVSSVSYNDVRIVGSEGLLYLCRGDEIISDGYVSLRSVNDGYAAASPNWLTANDTMLFDYYIARRAQQSQYLLITSAGKEYTIAGDNYSLASIHLPYLIFVNNTTGTRAALSLLHLNSDLSKLSDNELTLTPFLELTPVRKRAEDALYSHLEGKEATADAPYAVFTVEGKKILSAKSYERKLFSNDAEQASIYYANNDTFTVYSSRGEELCVGSAIGTAVNDSWGYMPLALLADGTPSGIAVFSYQKQYSITDPSLDYTQARFFNGSLLLPKKNTSTVVLYDAATGTSTEYTSVERLADGLLRATVSGNTDSLYLSESGQLLLRSPFADMTADPALSSDSCLVLSSADYDIAHDGLHHLLFVRENKPAVTATIEEGTDVSPLMANDGTLPIEDVFLLQSQQDGFPVYRLLAPFSDRLFSDAYDRLEIFSTAGIVWARGTSYAQKSFTILDPIGGQVATTIAAPDEQLSKLLFEYAGCESLLVDPHDADSAVPVLLLRLSCLEEGAPASSIRYFALYRDLPASSKSFDLATLRMLEIGKNLVRAEPVGFFADDNALICRNTDFSHVYRMSESNVLSEVTTLPYRVSRVISDQKDPTVKYFEVTTEDGKFGLYDVTGTSILSPYYDKIVAVNDGHLVVSLRGATGVLAYENGKLKQVIDYLYTRITPLPDHGYLVVDGNELTYLFDGKKKISRKPIQSYQTLTSYAIAENGNLCVGSSLLLSLDGRLWLHETDIRHEPFATELEKPNNVYGNVQNERAIAVHYYRGQDLIATDMIYPDAEHRAAFTLPEPPVGNGWYQKPDVTPDVDLPVTVNGLIASGMHTVKLYAVE